MTSIKDHPHLSMANGSAMAWAGTLVEPLMTLDRRIVAEDGMRQVFQRTPEWAGFFVAGSLASIVGSLPRNDPWRALSGRIAAAPFTGEDLVVGATPQAHGTGATFANRTRFGRRNSSADLLGDPVGPVEKDFAYAPLVDGLCPEATALIAFAADGWRAAAEAMIALRGNAVHDAALDLPDDIADEGRWVAARSGDELFEISTSAIRWAVHRRRLGMENQMIVTTVGAVHPSVGADLWPLEACWKWAGRADALMAGHGLDETAIASELGTVNLPNLT